MLRVLEEKTKESRSLGKVEGRQNLNDQRVCRTTNDVKDQ